MQSYFKVFSFQKLLLKETLSEILFCGFCLWHKIFLLLLLLSYNAESTVQKMKFFIQDFFRKCEQTRSFLFLFAVKTLPRLHLSFWKLFVLLSSNLQCIKLKNDGKSVLLTYSPLVILMNCMVLLLPFLEVLIMLISTVSLCARLSSVILYVLNAFLWPFLFL